MRFRNIVFAILVPFFAFLSPLMAQVNCQTLFLNQPQTVPKVEITQAVFEKTSETLKATIGVDKLATVWRAEWKTKLKVAQSNTYVFNLLKTTLSKATFNTVTKNLSIEDIDFVEKVHSRLYDLQANTLLNKNDDLKVRDMSPPDGVQDHNFTYYTKPLTVAGSEAKHQIRLRTYVREINFNELKKYEIIIGYNMYGQKFEIVKTGDTQIRVRIFNKNSLEQQFQDSTEGIKKTFGNKLVLFAPHGEKLKLEVKTVALDKILGKGMPLLAGKHTVSKLDVSLTLIQALSLFAPFNNQNPKYKTASSMKRIDALMADLMAIVPTSHDRIRAVFEVLKEGVKNDPDFLQLQGATIYQRVAFESNSGYQTTVDRAQGVYTEGIYDHQNHSLLANPLEIFKSSPLLLGPAEAERHVEFKVPVPSLKNTVGIEFVKPETAPSPQNTFTDGDIKRALEIFYPYVNSENHPGKFNYILKNQ